jgi:hypothetical protein
VPTARATSTTAATFATVVDLSRRVVVVIAIVREIREASRVVTSQLPNSSA